MHTKLYFAFFWFQTIKQYHIWCGSCGTLLQFLKLDIALEISIF